jgi:hypothetical protein
LLGKIGDLILTFGSDRTIVKTAQFRGSIARAAEGWVEAGFSDGGAPGVEDENERIRIRAKVDAIVAQNMFGLSVNQMEYVLTDFPTLAKRQIDRYNEFLTKRLILEAMTAN